MFSKANNLGSVDVSSFDTSNSKNMDYMFQFCNSLTTLDISSFDTSNLTSTDRMFYGSTQLQTIYASDKFVTSNVTSSSMMFGVCTSLVGGEGTAYSISHVDKSYAHIDGGTTNPGYFTRKN